jgi:hypothetical protein
MWQSLILIDALSSAYWEKFKKKKERKEKKKREMAKGLYSQGLTCLAGCAV